MMMQGVVVACGGEKRFGNLVTQDSPRCMLELGFKPMVWYALQTLEQGGVRDVFLVAAGEHFAGLFSDWVKGSYTGKCTVTVVAAPEDADTADALRAVMPRLTSPTVTVVSGDLVTDMHLEDVLATHVRRAAVATCLVSRRRPWAGVDAKTGRPPKGAHYIGLSGEHLLFMGDEEDVDKVLKLRRPVLRRTPSLMIHTDLLDCQLYVLDVKAVGALMDAKPNMHSLQLDVIPALVRRQFKASAATVGEGGGGAAGGGGGGGGDGDGGGGEGSAGGMDDGDDGLMHAVFGEGGKDGMGDGAAAAAAGGKKWSSAPAEGGRPCCIHLAPEDAYCARVDTVVPAFLEVSREVASPAVNDAAHLIGRNPSKYENFVETSVAIGAKSTIGPGCIVADAVTLAEKCSVKRSVIGAGCSIGTGVKIINSILMPRATVEDGCTVQGCVVGPRAVVGAGTSLRECLVAAEYEVEEGDDIRAETLATKSR